MKSLVDLLEQLLLDCGSRCGAPVARDVGTLRARVEHEGDSFITISLPAFAADFDRSLAAGGVVPGSFASFGKLRSGIPAFLQGFLHHVFDNVGHLRPEPRIDCIRAVRQVCLFGKKVRRDCSEERSLAAIAAYVTCDREVADSLPEGQLGRYFGRVADVLWRDFDICLDKMLEMMPRHGPGATVERVTGNGKWLFRRWHERLENVGFTYERFGGGNVVDESCEQPEFVEPEDEEPVRVTLVPKTLKTPRVIAVEPVCMQFAQQGLWRLLKTEIERSPFTGGHVNFTRQEVNQVLALDASSSGRLATLDMSEASDRVSLACVERMLESQPDFRRWALAARSTQARLPTGEVIRLKKFASMGSALCFPLEAMVFYTIIVAKRIMSAGKFPTPRTIRESGRDVYVYGDDIIVPSDEAPEIAEALEAFGLKVNGRKSFWTGRFRESCGVDAYDGTEVTPVYLRRDVPRSLKDPQGILSCVATANQLYRAGYVGTATALRKAVEHILGDLPSVPENSPAIGWVWYSDYTPTRRWNRDLQRWEYRCWVAVSTKDPDALDGRPALAKCFRTLLSGEDQKPDRDHLERSPRRYGLALKRRWVPLNM